MPMVIFLSFHYLLYLICGCKGTTFLLIIKRLKAKNAKIQIYKSWNIAKIQTFTRRKSANIQIYKEVEIAKIQTNNGRDRSPDRRFNIYNTAFLKSNLL